MAPGARALSRVGELGEQAGEAWVASGRRTPCHVDDRHASAGKVERESFQAEVHDADLAPEEPGNATSALAHRRHRPARGLP